MPSTPPASLSATDAAQNRLRDHHLRLTAGIASLAVGIFILAVKSIAFEVTGSGAILSDALESIINVVASGFALGSIIISAKPPDSDHPYGHGKVEFFSAGFEGGLIALAALGIFHVGWTRFTHPTPLLHLDWGLWLVSGAAALNLVVGVALIRIGNRCHSIALEADGRHLITDVYTTAGVVVGLVCARWTGWLWLDGVMAIAVGAHVLVAGVGLIRRSVAGLMDSTDPTVLDRICDQLNTHRRSQWIDIHKLRTWQSGQILFVDLHLVLPATLPLADAHAESELLESLLEEAFDNRAEILVHLEPASMDIPTIDPDAEGLAACPEWTRTSLTSTQSADPMPASEETAVEKGENP